jgi:serine/threonine protein kinase
MRPNIDGGPPVPGPIEPAASGAEPTHATALSPATTDFQDRPVASDSPRLPEQFGRYRVLRPLGQGGMGAVYLAHDSQLDRKVALKVPFLSASNPSMLERFHREGRAAATLHHANVCPIHDVGQIDGIHYLAMAYIEGEPLSDVLRKNGPMPPAEAARIVRTLALALSEAHAKGVIHRDLKPSNVMMARNGQPVIMDFGLARRSNAGDAQLTRDGAALGTPAYMPPEQINGQVDAMGPTSDVYSLGVILYELLTGKVPYPGPSAFEMIAQALSIEPKRPSLLRPELSPELEAVTMKAMAKKLSDRYPGMKEFARALDDYLGKPAQASMAPPNLAATIELPPAAPNRKRSRRRIAIALAMLGVLGAIIAYQIIIKYTDKDGKDKTVQAAPGSVVVIENSGKEVARIAVPGAPEATKTDKPSGEEKPAGDGKPLATAKHPKGLLVELLELKVDKQDKLTVRWRYTNKSKKAVELVEATGPFVVPLRSSPVYKFYGEVHYQEADTAKTLKHPILKFNDGQYDATSVTKGITIEPGDMYECWAKFPLPSLKVETIAIQLPDIELLQEVPFRYSPPK